MKPKELKREVADLLTEIDPETTGTVEPASTSSKTHTLKTILIILAMLVATGAAYGAYSLLTAPTGKITSPAEASQTSRIVEITGYTKNIPPDRRYIWITVDIKDLGLCWPKRPIYKPNEPFKTQIHERGPNKNFVVSLYAVDQVYHQDILKWFDFGTITNSNEGFPIIPETFKLDSVALMLKGI